MCPNLFFVTEIVELDSARLSHGLVRGEANEVICKGESTGSDRGLSF